VLAPVPRGSGAITRRSSASSRSCRAPVETEADQQGHGRVTLPLLRVADARLAERDARPQLPDGSPHILLADSPAGSRPLDSGEVDPLEPGEPLCAGRCAYPFAAGHLRALSPFCALGAGRFAGGSLLGFELGEECVDVERLVGGIGQHREHLAAGHGLALGHDVLPQDAVVGGLDLELHLLRLDHQHDLAAAHRLPLAGAPLEDGPLLHGQPQLRHHERRRHGRIASLPRRGARMRLDREMLREAYRRMRTIRVFEEKLAELSLAGKLPGFLHLYAGEEATAVGVCMHLRDDDFLCSTHRGHGHCIAKGVGIDGMMAELFGKSTGLCKGKGGSMHIADLDRGMIGANGIVGAGIPLATGAALTAQTRGNGQVAVAFFGDGAANEGSFHESLNLASIWKLPVLYVVENNGYGEATPAEYAMNITDIADRAASYGIPGVIADGMDLLDVYEKAGEAIERARAGEGPTLLECKTYRYFGHYVGDPLTYRTKEETEEVRQTRDPLELLERNVVEELELSDADALREIDAEAVAAVEAAVAFAESSDPPDPREVTTDVYVSYPESS
jgi:pyruvate dehydrogenase E1 component alpha subunit